MTELDDRKAAILRSIVEHYVETAQPVGSQTVTHAGDLGVSAATVRNEMSSLEREGYIAQPHTSAGRIPTDLGYRYYVDHFAGTTNLPQPQRREIAEFFTSATRAMEELLHETSQLLARVTSHAAVVVGPQAQAATIRSAHLVSLQPRLALAVVVLSNGVVEKEVVELAEDAEEALVEQASARLDAALRGMHLAEAALGPDPAPNDGATDGLLAAALEALGEHLAAHRTELLYVGGASRLAAEGEAFPVVGAARLLDLLERHVVVAAVLRELLGPGITVRIGAENEQDELRECSLVLAPYLVEGEPAGTVGVLGPTRMDYRRARAAVAAVSQQLGRQLSP